MKKIFATIISLAALVGCNTPVNETVVTTLCAPMEVALDGNSRAYDNNLEWAWEADDTIAALQAEGNMTVNTLTLKENGKFGTDNFVYATDAPAVFMFVYPAEALDMQTGFKYIQTGVWTPLLIGYAYDATVGNIGQVVMEHQSAAFEIRVWEAGRQTRKKITAATITSTTSDFLNGASNFATVEGLDSDTVVFNLANGDYAFELSLTDAEGVTYNVAVPSMNFAVGKRTVLNVEWKAEPAVEPTLSFNVYSSFTNKDNSLDGRSIYVKDIVLTDADSATIELYLNGAKAADLTPGQNATVSNLAIGEYKAVVKWSANGKQYTSDEVVVYVTGVPCVADYLNSSYSGWDFTGGISFTTKEVKVKVGGSFFNPVYETYYYNCASIKSNGAIVSPEFGKNVSFGVTVDVAAQKRNVDFGSIDSASYGNIYMSAGTKNSTGSKSDIYCTSTYSSSGNPADGAMNNYTGAVSGVVVSPSAPCLVCYREYTLYEGYIYRIKVEYTK